MSEGCAPLKIPQGSKGLTAAHWNSSGHPKLPKLTGAQLFFRAKMSPLNLWAHCGSKVLTGLILKKIELHELRLCQHCLKQNIVSTFWQYVETTVPTKFSRNENSCQSKRMCQSERICQFFTLIESYIFFSQSIQIWTENIIYSSSVNFSI